MVKCEHLNPGGSVKDRAALRLIEEAERSGKIKPGDTIIDASGGNTSIAMALIASAKGYKPVMVTNSGVSKEKLDEAALCGVESIICPCVPFTDPRHMFHVAAKLAAEKKNCLFTNQFDSRGNYLAHFEGTAPEIWEQTKHKVDAFVVASGTGGTIAGISAYLKERDPKIKVYHLDNGSSAAFDFIKSETSYPTEIEGYKVDLLPRPEGGKSMMEGVGIDRITGQFKQAKVDGAIRITDLEAVEMAYYLKEYEGLFIGPSAALNVVGAVKAAKLLGPGNTIVTIICDGGIKYKSKLWNEEFLKEHQLVPK